MYELEQKKNLELSKILNLNLNAAEVAKSRSASAPPNLLHSGNKESRILMGVHITHNLLDEKGVWFP